MNIIEEITPLVFDRSALLGQAHIKPRSADEKEFLGMLEAAEKAGVARFVYRKCPIADKTKDAVVVEGITFTSRVLARNLENCGEIFPFLATCGMELEEWGKTHTDWVTGYWAEIIKEAALRVAILALHRHLQNQFAPGHVSSMSPGSLESWPIAQQEPLFRLLGNPPEVQLTDSMLMVPTKSVSGVLFARDESFESCQLCPRDMCPNRRAPYDETLFEKEYCPAES